VETAVDGLDALDKVGGALPDAIILDISMRLGPRPPVGGRGGLRRLPLEALSPGRPDSYRSRGRIRPSLAAKGEGRFRMEPAQAGA
jgi:hypothetical protein